MTRVISGAVLLACAVAAVWFAPPPVFFLIAEALLVLAFREYATLAADAGPGVPPVAAGAATVLASIGITSTSYVDGVMFRAAFLDIMLMTGFIALASMTLARWRGGPDALERVSAATFPALYLGLPIGALVSIRESHGAPALFLLMLTIAVSDTSQYYTGRLFGKRPLAPQISPKKTVEGAIGGFVAGALLLVIAGRWWLPDMPVSARAILGLTLVALGVAGDLFESMLKRSAGVKDSSALIPGHGGVLDRIDALLFAAPVYYIVLKYV